MTDLEKQSNAVSSGTGFEGEPDTSEVQFHATEHYGMGMAT